MASIITDDKATESTSMVHVMGEIFQAKLARKKNYNSNNATIQYPNENWEMGVNYIYMLMLCMLGIYSFIHSLIRSLIHS